LETSSKEEIDVLVEVETATWKDSEGEVPTNAADGTNAATEQLLLQNDTAMTVVNASAVNFMMGSVR
jgi:hypothetical protein